MQDHAAVTDSPEQQPDSVQLHLRYPLRSQQNGITRLAWSPDGSTLAAASFDRLISLWDVQTGLKRADLKGHTHSVTALAWSADSRTLATGSRDGRVCFWPLAEQDQPCQILPGNRIDIWDLAWFPTFPYLAVALADNTILVWDVVAVKLHALFKAHTSMIRRIVCAPDGQLLASISDDKTMRLWDQSLERCTQLYQLPAIPYSLAWQRHSPRVAIGLFDQTIQIWDVDLKTHCATLQGHSGGVVALDFSADGQWLASKSFDGTVRIWHCQTQQTVKILNEFSGGSWPTALAFHPHLPLLATLDDLDTNIRLWELQSTEPSVTLAASI